MREGWLRALAAALEHAADELVALADEETALGESRLRSELATTAQNARYYGAVGAAGEWLHARIETVPGPVPITLRSAHLPLGPVAIFGASNFPFQFGVVGHDTCTALAVGCPVIAKAHPAHPRLSKRLSEITTNTLALAGAPSGSFQLVSGFDAGLTLVDSATVQAVGFTGSQRGGLALVERASHRPRPIPVFAEMGTVNPVVVTPSGSERVHDISTGFANSFTLGVGQFCTKPGLLLVPANSGIPDALASTLGERTGGWMLSASIANRYAAGLDGLVAAGGRVLATGRAPAGGYGVRPHLIEASVEDLVVGSPLLDECFGPVALVARYKTTDEAAEVIQQLQPSLTGAVWSDGTPSDPLVERFVSLLAGQVGRVIVDGWPTGVACADAMHHGGPWPATSRPDASSVGAAALERWTRPVAFQDVPEAALHPALRDGNPWRLLNRSRAH